jgi:ABC-type sugar transport system ATPase subunit
MDSPTQGMSTADREDIYRLIYSLADKGASIIIISDDNSEIVRACDRALIMRRDRATVELTDGRIDEEFIEEINSRA